MLEQINKPSLVARARQVLQRNDRGRYTVPSQLIYPHQWLWDSCFVAIGMRHYAPRRAAQEILSLFRGQWKNGMLPNIIFSEQGDYWAGPNYWQSQISEFAPDIPTSTITQPPLPAVAALAVSQKLDPTEAQVFLKQAFPKLLAYHSWIYHERDPNGSGLAVLVHPWESGLDNSPPWIKSLSSTPLWITIVMKSGTINLLRRLRKDVKKVPSEQKLTDIEALKLIHRLYRFRKRDYNSLVHLQKSRDTIEDLGFNSVLAQANQALDKIAKLINEDIPPDLSYRFSQTQKALEELWDEKNQQYYSRHYKRQRLIKVDSIASLMPLYSQVISEDRAAVLERTLSDTSRFWPTYPVPSVPLDSSYFNASRYWQGPTWLNMNWLLIQGLRHYGYKERANSIKEACIELVMKSGFHEYFSPLDGTGYGIDNFSWSAALLIDLLEENNS